MKQYVRHHSLEEAKELIRANNFNAKGKARRTAAAMGFDETDMAKAILSLTVKNFRHSMTTYTNSSEWQDVYGCHYEGEDIYLKFTIENGVMIWSFAEDGYEMY